MELKILMIGFGHVGRGFADLLIKKQQLLRQKLDLSIKTVGIITRSKGKIIDPEGVDLQRALNASRAGKTFKDSGLPTIDALTESLLASVDYDALVELSVTNLKDGQPATSYIRIALERRKDVITANKGPIALHLDELKELARKNGVQLRYEGTVMAGTPLINLIQSNLAGLEIKKMQGIVNGSTNYILTRMEEGLEYDQAVAEARQQGYLEADPTADVEGWDAVAKTMILARDVFGVSLSKEAIQRKGISALRKADVERAREENRVWKLIATLEKVNGALNASVQPRLLDRAHPLAGVRGTTNAMTLTTDFLQEVTIVGPGAGEQETGYAVFNDLLAVAGKL
ncbi:homoserine dehydrogenase [Calditrichota bacterium LG25]